MSKLLFEFTLWRYRMRDDIPRWIAWHLPNRVVMWCYMRVGGYATSGKYGASIVPDISMMEAIERFSKDNNL